MTLAFRNPDKLQVLGFREYMRQHLPGPSEGLALEDLDLVCLQFGGLIGRKREDDGRFMLIEVKNMGSNLGYAQARLYQLMHRILRNGDPARQFYDGFYLLQWNHQDNLPHSVNYAPISEREFCAWMMGKLALPSMFDIRGDD